MASRASTANNVTAASMCAALPKNLSPTMPLPRYQLGLAGIGSGDVCGPPFAGTAKVGVGRRHQKVQHIDVVPVLSGHPSTLDPAWTVRISYCPEM